MALAALTLLAIGGAGGAIKSLTQLCGQYSRLCLDPKPHLAAARPPPKDKP